MDQPLADLRLAYSIDEDDGTFNVQPMSDGQVAYDNFSYRVRDPDAATINEVFTFLGISLPWLSNG